MIVHFTTMHTQFVCMIEQWSSGSTPPPLIDQLINFFTRPWFKSFKAQTFDPPSPPPQNVVSSFGGIEGSKSKNPLGDRFVKQNNDFTRG